MCFLRSHTVQILLNTSGRGSIRFLLYKYNSIKILHYKFKSCIKHKYYQQMYLKYQVKVNVLQYVRNQWFNVNVNLNMKSKCNREENTIFPSEM